MCGDNRKHEIRWQNKIKKNSIEQDWLSKSKFYMQQGFHINFGAEKRSPSMAITLTAACIAFKTRPIIQTEIL